MENIKIYVEELISLCGLTGELVPYIRHFVLVVLAIVLASLSGYVCRRFIPLIHKLTSRTSSAWDDVLLNDEVLRSASNIVPAIVIWQLLPLTFYEFPFVREILARLTAIYITVMMVRTIIVMIDSLKLLEGDTRTAKQQYLYSFCGMLKIILIFIAVIVIISILVNQSPMTLLAGLGAASAVMMLVFQDTIKGLVAGIRLTSNDMLHKGDWIAVTKAGANGIVEDISLTTVKIRNFDNTVTTVTPQTLVDDSFHNWTAMQQSPGRRVCRKVFYDFRTIRIADEELRRRLLERHLAEPADVEPAGVVNLTLLRLYAERYLRSRADVNTDLTIVVRQQEATQAGLPLEFCFFVRNVEGMHYEHSLAEIMEHIYAVTQDFGLSIYQLNG